jgi:foldase protein PrsA
MTFLALVCLLAACGDHPTPAATVGSTTISDAQLAKEAKLYTFAAGLSQQKCGTAQSGESAESACNRFALANLIVASLAARYADQHQVTVSDSQVSDTLKGLDSQLGAARVNQTLSSNSLTRADLERLARESLLVNAVEQALAKEQVTDEQLHALYVKDRLQFTTIDVEHILVKTKSEADKVYAQVTAPGATEKDFKSLAEKVSTDTQSGANGGDLGSAPASQYVSEFANAAVALKPGQISKPVKSQFGWHVIRLISKQVTPFSQAGSQLLKTEGTQALTAWLQTESKTEGVSVNPKYGRFNQQTLSVDRISSTETTSTAPTGPSGSGPSTPTP